MTREKPEDLAREAFDALVVEHGPRLFAIAYLMLSDRATAEDAVQDTLIKAWRHVAELSSIDSREAWLRQVLLNTCRDQVRRDHRRRRLIESLTPPPRGTDIADPVAVADEIAEAMRRLSHEHREVLVLRYYADLSAKDIGQAIKAPEGTVRSRIHHGLRALRAALEAGR